jgi:hypothetical protein
MRQGAAAVSEKRSSGGTSTVPIFIIVAISIVWVLVRPDLWVWALCFAVFTIIMLAHAHNAGMRQGRESLKSSEPFSQDKDKPEEKSIEESQLEAIESVMAEANLYAYELEQGLVPDGNTEHNPGYGPMDFDEWREWKQQEFERTGNIWHNHPGGLPPKESDTA